ncbi:MAG TPA: hypothetical protein VL282_04820, partial [Tepidisphaeraceae bacterium]|nr:hypothetical protein [Tepidisphaeraceae bacterium]
MLDVAPTTPPKQKKKKRWVLRAVGLLILLLIGIVITVQVVLGTAYPKKLVIGEVERALGLNVKAQSLTTGWWGHTVLRDVTISLPLADQAFLKVPELRVEHSTLPMIALKRGVKLDYIEFDHPAMVVRQDETGRWDLQQAIELMTRASGAKNTQEQKQPTLPALKMIDGSIRIIDRNAREATIEPFNFEGRPLNSLAWEFSANANDRLKVEGAVNPGGAWEHTAKFVVGDIEGWTKPWVKSLPNPLNANGKWEGRVTNGQVRGQARFESVVVGDMKGSGVVNVLRDEVGVHLMPDGLIVESPAKMVPEVRVRSGAITVQANRVVADDVQVSAAGGDLRLKGNYSWADVAGELEASWEELALPRGTVHGGNAKVSLKTPLANRPEIAAEFHTRGKSGAGQWNGDLQLSGKGESWQKIDWTLSAPLLEYAAIKHHFEVRSLAAHLATADNKLRLLDVTHGGPEIIRASGEFDLTDKKWNVNASASSLQLPDAEARNLDLAIQATGEALTQIDVKQAHLRQSDLLLEAKGSYDKRLPKPVNLTVTANLSPTIAEVETDPLGKGKLESESTIAGTLQPLDIGVAGNLKAEQLSVRNHTLGDATLQFHGRVTSAGALVKTTELVAFGGRWNIEGTWAGEDEPVNIHATVRDLPMEQLSDVTRQNNISGTLKGEWDIVTSSLRPSKMKVTGTAKIDNPAAGPVTAERLTAAMSMKNGIVRLDSIEGTREKGRLQGSASFPVLRPTQWHLEGKMTDWPGALPREGSSIRLAGETILDADFANRTATGTLSASSDIVLDRQLTGVAKVSVVAQGDVFKLEPISANLVGGTLTGSAAVSISDPLKSNLIVQLQNLDARRLAGIWPQLSELEGNYNALIVAAPSQDPRALGPLRLSLTVHPTGGKFRTIEIGNIDVVAFADRSQGQSRFVIDDSMLNVADGQVRVWGRRSRHSGATTQEVGPVSTQV